MAEYILIILFSSCLAYLLLYRNMRFFKIPSASMEPTLQLHDYLVTLKHPTYRRGDIVVLRDPKGAGGYVVKRIIGTSGDEIAVRAGALFVNGSYASEPYVPEPMVYRISPVRVPADMVFILGDNRNNSEDSHVWLGEADPDISVGSLPRDSIIGKVHLIYLPLNRMGRVHSYPLRNSKGA